MPKPTAHTTKPTSANQSSATLVADVIATHAAAAVKTTQSPGWSTRSGTG